jgi:hypothetical protein
VLRAVLRADEAEDEAEDEAAAVEDEETMNLIV